MIENELYATVTIDGRIMSGFVAQEVPCADCGSASVFSLGHWSHFCAGGNAQAMKNSGDEVLRTYDTFQRIGCVFV